MHPLALSFSLVAAFFISSASGVTKPEVFNEIRRLGEEVRNERTKELQTVIKETLLRAVQPHQTICVNTQISQGYRELNQPLSMEMNSLKREYKAMSPPDLDLMTMEEVSTKIKERIKLSLGLFINRLKTMSECAPSM